MSSQRLRSNLYHAVPRPQSQPPPLWQTAAALDPAAVSTDTAERTPMTSAVSAGWICVGIGLLTAWFFPLAHVFFSIAIVLSVVAMATHQVRHGLLLLAGAFAGIGICAVLFICGVAMMVAGALHAASKPRPPFPNVSVPAPAMRLATPAVSTSRPRAQAGTVGGNSYSNTNLRSDALTEVLNLLAAGKRDEDILAAATGRIDPRRIGPSEVTSLRAYGASERLIDDLRQLPANGNVQPPFAYSATPPPPVRTAPPAPAFSTAPPVAAPVDYAARDREIVLVQKRIDQLDETVRRVRADPHTTGLVSGSTNTARQQSSDAYLAQLDKQRDELRRQKWALEGR